MFTNELRFCRRQGDRRTRVPILAGELCVPDVTILGIKTDSIMYSEVSEKLGQALSSPLPV